MKILKKIGLVLIFVVIYFVLFTFIPKIVLTDHRSPQEMATGTAKNLVQSYLMGVGTYCNRDGLSGSMEYFCFQSFNSLFYFVNLIYTLLIFLFGRWIITLIKRN